jgi:hypothetical protein
MREGKSEGTLCTSHSSIGQELIGRPPSIADDFNPSVNRHVSCFITFYRSGCFPRGIAGVDTSNQTYSKGAPSYNAFLARAFNAERPTCC